MSGGEGLAKLTEYLNQTRRQAEASIDVLNTKIQALTEENEKLAGERDQYRRYAEQLQTEGSKKSRFQERDDWKALLDSVQRDRSRLQDECARLAGELEQARAEATVLEQELHHAQGTGAHDGGGDTTGTRGDGVGTGVGNDALSSSSAGAGDAAAGVGSPRSRGLGGPRGLTVDVPDAVAFFSTPGPGQGQGQGQAGASSPPSRPSRKSSFDGGQQPYPLPNAGLGPGAPPLQPSSPRAVSTRLQIELQRALAQLESERQTHADEKAALQVDIRRLEAEVERVRNMLPRSVRHFVAGQHIPLSHRAAVPYRGGGGHGTPWYAVPLSIFSFFFASPAPSVPEGPDAAILNV